jgi:Na+/melibiose symporter-like transporter
MQNKAWAIYFLLPGLCMLASSLVMFFYKIDEKTKKQMREELALRRGEAREETVAENAVDALSEASEDFEVSEENDKTE